MITDLLPKTQQADILHIGKLLGSASYNMALELFLRDGRDVVLLLLRENAARDARRGFDHLYQSINVCSHERINDLRPAALAMLKEAKELSEMEMNYEKSMRQYRIADNLYHCTITSSYHYKVNIFPSRLIVAGVGYRLIERVYGIEFNDLPAETVEDRQIRSAVAKAILYLELVHILQGKFFDSDRHGNQLRIAVDKTTKTINAGLYDFGEMSLEMPKTHEIEQLASVLRKVPKAGVKSLSFTEVFDSLISRYIEKAAKKNIDTHYLMRVRKGLLALQDFQKQLTFTEVIEVLKAATSAPHIHPVLADALIVGSVLLGAAEKCAHVQNHIQDSMRIFGRKKARDHSHDKLRMEKVNPRNRVEVSK
jgi:hypothetical protein